MQARFYYDEGSCSDAIMVCNLFREWIGWLNTSIDEPEPHSRHFLVRQFARNSPVRCERMLQLEYTVSEIASRVQIVEVAEGGEMVRKEGGREGSRYCTHVLEAYLYSMDSYKA